jgi:hypothetical protein
MPLSCQIYIGYKLGILWVLELIFLRIITDIKKRLKVDGLRNHLESDKGLIGSSQPGNCHSSPWFIRFGLRAPRKALLIFRNYGEHHILWSVFLSGNL